MRRLLPPLDQEIDVEHVYRDVRFPDPPTQRPYMILNFVVSLDGQATLGDGGAAGLGSKTDHRLMAYLRTTADGLMHGAGTVRADNFPPVVPPDLVPLRRTRGLSPQPRGIIISASGDIPVTNRYFSAGPPLLITTEDRQAEVARRLTSHAEVIGVGERMVDLPSALHVLREGYGMRLVLCEGGPVLTHNLIKLDLVDELFLTLAPVLGGDSHARRLLEGAAFPAQALPRATLLQLFANGSELFLRYRLQPAAKEQAAG
jgi:riboflavin-specific deaminase-like protein